MAFCLKTIEGSDAVNFEVPWLSSLREFLKDQINRNFDLTKSSYDHPVFYGEVGDGSGGINGIFNRPEVADEVTSVEHVDRDLPILATPV